MDKDELENLQKPSSDCKDSWVTVVVKDPHQLFAYWEISEEKKENFINKLGSELWQKSVPALKVINVSSNTEFYLKVNEYSSSCYIDIPNSNCQYAIEVGRNVNDHFFISLADSNYISVPNDKVSPNTSAYFANYQDIQNGIVRIEAPEICGFPFEGLYSGADADLCPVDVFYTDAQPLDLGISSAEFCSPDAASAEYNPLLPVKG